MLKFIKELPTMVKVLIVVCVICFEIVPMYKQEAQQAMAAQSDAVSEKHAARINNAINGK